MKLKNTALIAFASALVLAGCRYTGPSTSTTIYPTTPTVTPTVTPTPSLNDLNAELNATVDDGGAAELKQLQTEQQGL